MDLKPTTFFQYTRSIKTEVLQQRWQLNYKEISFLTSYGPRNKMLEHSSKKIEKYKLKNTKAKVLQKDTQNY